MNPAETRTPEIRARIARRAAHARLEIDSARVEALAAYVELLMRWNRRINLTALGADDRGLDKLVIEPLLAARHLPKHYASVIDIGSGNGSPAIPMKLAASSARLHMVESRTRKAAFLREVVRQLRLKHTFVENCRYEALIAQRVPPEGFDVVTVRAVRIGSQMLRRVQRLTQASGVIFLFSGADGQIDVPPPLRVEATHALLASPDSRLLVLRNPQRPSASD